MSAPKKIKGPRIPNTIKVPAGYKTAKTDKKR